MPLEPKPTGYLKRTDANKDRLIRLCGYMNASGLKQVEIGHLLDVTGECVCQWHTQFPDSWEEGEAQFAADLASGNTVAFDNSQGSSPEAIAAGIKTDDIAVLASRAFVDGLRYIIGCLESPKLKPNLKLNAAGQALKLQSLVSTVRPVEEAEILDTPGLPRLEALDLSDLKQRVAAYNRSGGDENDRQIEV